MGLRSVFSGQKTQSDMCPSARPVSQEGCSGAQGGASKMQAALLKQISLHTLSSLFLFFCCCFFVTNVLLHVLEKVICMAVSILYILKIL